REHAQLVSDNLPGIDLAWVDRYIGGNRALLAKLLKNFNHYHSDCCARIDKALAEGDVTEAQHITHTLQGVSGSVGARDLQNAAQALDDAIRQLDPEVIEDRKQKFCEEAMRVFRGLKGSQGQWEAADELGPSRKEPGDSASADRIMSIIDRLSGYLQAGDTEAKVVLKTLQVVVDTSEKEIQELMSQLQGQMAEYEYDDALTTLRILQEWYANKLMRRDDHGREQALYPGGG
ncbi:MAG: Hpt domain-containing protein, partial [Pseudomonadota bacterium]